MTVIAVLRFVQPIRPPQVGHHDFDQIILIAPVGGNDPLPLHHREDTVIGRLNFAHHRGVFIDDWYKFVSGVGGCGGRGRCDAAPIAV